MASVYMRQIRFEINNGLARNLMNIRHLMYELEDIQSMAIFTTSRCQPNFKAIANLETPISRLRDFTISYDWTSNRLLTGTLFRRWVIFNTNIVPAYETRLHVVWVLLGNLGKLSEFLGKENPERPDTSKYVSLSYCDLPLLLLVWSMRQYSYSRITWVMIC